MSPQLPPFECTDLAGALKPLPNCTQGSVYNELLASNDYGQHWQRLAPGRQWIPHGAAGEHDSSIIYAGRPLLNPTNHSETMIFYDGGRGPHSGPHREDTINLATCLTDAYAGLATVPTQHNRASNGTTLHHPLRWTLSTVLHPTVSSVHVLAQLGENSSLLAEWFAPPGSDHATSSDSLIGVPPLRLQVAAIQAMRAPRWISLSLSNLDLSRQQSSIVPELWVEIQGHGTLFALQQQRDSREADKRE